MTDKPADCTCNYPVIKCRNGSGHAPLCPVHLRWEAEFISKKQPAVPAPSDLERAVAYFQALNPLNMWSGVEIAAALREKWWER